MESTGFEVTGIVKRFAGVPALRGVSLTLRPGEVVGLVGHNGAGKSTLLKVMAGAHRPDEGTIMLDGRPVTFHHPSEAIAAGVSTVYQELSLLTNLTITQNVFLGREVTSGGVLRRAQMHAEAEDLVRSLGLDVDVTRPLGEYPVATRQLLEIAVATHRDARYILLDEPTTSLEGGQVEQLLEQVRELSRDRGLGILLVNHKLDELYAVADHVVALVDGLVRISGPVDQVSRDDVVQAIVGDDHDAVVSPQGQLTDLGSRSRSAAESARTLQVRNLRTPILHDVSLTARPGRVLGLYGLVGSGRTEFLRALVGLDPILSGEISFGGEPYRPKSPSHAQKKGVVYLTEERKKDGIVGGLDSPINVVLPVLDRFKNAGVLRVGQMRNVAHEYLDAVRVIGNRAAPVVSLSGGNQQKVLIARALAQEPRVLLLDEPTKGVDIGVKADIHALIARLAHDDGMTVLLVSSEEEEVVENSDDIVVFVNGYCDGVSHAAKDVTPADLRRLAWSGA